MAGVNRKGKCDEELADAKKGDRSRLGNLGGPAAEENGLLARLSNELDAIIKDEWSISRSDWVEFIEGDLKKGGKSIHSITRLAAPPPVGEVEVGGVTRSDDPAMLQAEHDKWSKIWGAGRSCRP